ncbi:MAG: hypothetical protein ACR2ML_02120 [Solirubrobacteraceae bacterium]
MTLWWIGNVVFLVVVIPIVIVLLGRLLAPVKRIGRQADGLDKRAGSLVTALDAVDQLPRTQQLVNQTGAGLGRYGAALDEIL